MRSRTFATRSTAEKTSYTDTQKYSADDRDACRDRAVVEVERRAAVRSGVTVGNVTAADGNVVCIEAAVEVGDHVLDRRRGDRCERRHVLHQGRMLDDRRDGRGVDRLVSRTAFGLDPELHGLK